MDVALVTYSELPALNAHDQPLLAALAAEGLSSGVVRWDDPGFDWSTPGLCLLRSPWDYTERLTEFLAWIAKPALRGKLWNPPHVVRWNSHKAYLRELEAAGAPIVPTQWCPRGTSPFLKDVLATRGWTQALVKPAVSSGARGAFRVSAPVSTTTQEQFVRLLKTCDAMVQPYLPTIEAEGERSLVYFDGVFSHAFHRPAGMRAPGTIPEASLVTATAEEQRLAQNVLTAAPGPLLLARVDLVRGLNGGPQLIELELIDPVLFLGAAPELAPRLAAAVRLRLLERKPKEVLRLIDPADPLYAQELELRFKVLRDPLGHARADVPYPFEAQCLHLLALEKGKVVGCVLFHPQSEHRGRLMQMAVHADHQKRGLGARLVKRLEDELRARGFKEVVLHSRSAVVPFYEKLGYGCSGEPFEEVGLVHRTMARRLTEEL